MAETKAAYPPGRNVLEDLDSRIPTGFYWYLAVLACIGGFLFGYDTSNIGSALDFIPYHLSSFATGYLVGGASLGAAVGALVAGPVTDRLGRKALLITDAAIYALGAILSAVTVNVAMLRSSRRSPCGTTPSGSRGSWCASLSSAVDVFEREAAGSGTTGLGCRCGRGRKTAG
jgi:MFS transporter, SP family, arabinose:H+ symporter